MYTKGNWIKQDNVNYGDDIVIENESRTKSIMTVHNHAATANDGEMADREAQANARLIAAAPGLLKACKAAKDALLSYKFGNSSVDLADEVSENLRQLIEKAEK